MKYRLELMKLDVKCDLVNDQIMHIQYDGAYINILCVYSYETVLLSRNKTCITLRFKPQVEVSVLKTMRTNRRFLESNERHS